MTLHLYSHWSPMTDTTEMKSALRGVPLDQAPTQEIAWWEPRPTVTATRYQRPSHWTTARRYGWLIGLLIAGLLMVAVTW